MVERRRTWRALVAVLAALALGYGAWRSRWLWGLAQGRDSGGAGGQETEADLVAVAGDPLGAQLDGFLSRLAAYGYSGSVLVAKGGRILLHEGYGLADRAARRPYTPETLFDIASIAKQFTAAAILKLEMEGKLKVEDPLGKFFPGAPPEKAAITLHQILTHTSGLRDTFGDEYEPITRGELLRRVFASQLLGRPGRRYRYSNGGYSVLAAVVEVASGESYDDYLRSRLFTPAGMRHTGFRVSPADRARLAHGYGAGGDWGTPLDHPWAADGPYWELRGNGGILSTTGDLYRWHLALQGNRVLSAPERAKYVTPYVSEGRWAHTEYGYGWSIGKSPTGKTEISHIGGNGYFEADFRRYVGDDAVIILSGNSVDFSALAIGDHLENRLFGLPDAEPPKVAGLPGIAAGGANPATPAHGVAPAGGANPANPADSSAGAAPTSAPGAPATPASPASPATTAAVAARCAGVYQLAAADGGESLAAGADTEVGAPAGRLGIAAQGPHGLALLLGALSDDDRAMVQDRDQRVAAALAAARQGDWAPFAQVMGLEPPEASALLAARIAPVQRRLGAWTDSALLGGAARGGRWYTYARCGFAQGGAVAEVGWAGPTAETLRLIGAVPAQLFLLESPGIFAAFDVRTGVTVRAAFELPPAGGAATAVTLRSGAAAAVQALRPQ
jgi:CubicO group peptidase (beta-lactamase class C family)